jgi:mannose-6-phosphate isomerase-like protein (cupin superfamily)
MTTQTMTTFPVPLPADNMSRKLVVARPNTDQSLPHIALVGDNYTVMVSSQETGGAYSLMDMLIPSMGEGPPPHRHGYEELYFILDGQIELTVRGETVTLNSGEAASIPAYAPHHFRNPNDQPARFLCMTTTGGQEAFFRDIGTLVATRTSPAPALDDSQQAEFIHKAVESGMKNGTELLPPPGPQ